MRMVNGSGSLRALRVARSGDEGVGQGRGSVQGRPQQRLDLGRTVSAGRLAHS